MRIHIIRHGDPDYDNDTLTDLGHQQARALSKALAGYPIRAIASSPMGRARDTAAYTADALSLPVEVLPWVREMDDVTVPSHLRDDLAVWHVPPRQSVSQIPAEDWMQASLFKGTALARRMRELSQGVAALLSPYGLRSVPGGYSLQRDLSCAGDLAVFCHQGAGLTLAAFLLGIPPPVIWRSCYIAPTSVTTLLLEQSEQHFASFRMLCMGNTSHLACAKVHVPLSGLLYNQR